MFATQTSAAQNRQMYGTCKGKLFVFTLLVFLTWSPLLRAATTPTTCTEGALPHGNGEDLIVSTGTCMVGQGVYKFHNVNIIKGGELLFQDEATDFWAESILIENSGSLIAGAPTAPIGTSGGRVTIHLYGKDQGTTSPGGQGIPCVTPPNQNTGPCGIPSTTWSSNTTSVLNPAACTPSKLPGGVTDCFYQYQPLDYDGGGTVVGYFGYKVLAVSYGGTLQLFGKKGATYSTLSKASSGTSWARLNAAVQAGGNTLLLDRAVDWAAGDQIVLTTTDYLPGHSEQLTIASVSTANNVTTITLKTPAQYPHNGQRFSLAGVPGGIGPDPDPNLPTGNAKLIDTRAAVGLLNRSLRIVSEGDALDAPFPSDNNNPPYYFGGHTIVRQGFQSFQIQGVEFYHMGQGGRIMHYPVHFHMARQTPANTFIADSSVHDSMTRWYTIHATAGVTLERNVGYLSIGHGYYMEDGSETGNMLYSNLGVFARGGVSNPQNPRSVPGILAAAHHNSTQDEVPFHTDTDHPTDFWITNGWNDFEYNMAAGAGTCGMCYWLVPATNSGASRYEYWNYYAGEQQYRQQTVGGVPGVDDLTQAGITPLMKFVGNSCTTAQNSFITIGDTAECDLGAAPQIPPIINPLAPDFPQDTTTQAFSPAADAYYPKVPSGGSRAATECTDPKQFCGKVTQCGTSNTASCMITDIDHYTRRSIGRKRM